MVISPGKKEIRLAVSCGDSDRVRAFCFDNQRNDRGKSGQMLFSALLPEPEDPDLMTPEDLACWRRKNWGVDREANVLASVLRLVEYSDKPNVVYYLEHETAYPEPWLLRASKIYQDFRFEMEVFDPSTSSTITVIAFGGKIYSYIWRGVK